MQNWKTWFFKMILKRWEEDKSVSQEVESSREEYGPRAGQRGKDVEWVPCSPVVMNKMFELAGVGPGDYLIDPGSGDGRMVISAAKLGAQALGVEFNPRMVELSRKEAEKEGVGDRASFVEGDFFLTDLSPASVVALFLRKDINIALRSKVLDLTPGTRVVSNIFDMGEWQADEVVKVEDENYYFKNHTVYFWVVPAKVNGVWKFPEGELSLEQNFQMITGTLKSKNDTFPVIGKMTGACISFIADRIEYKGIVSGNLMEIETNDKNVAWWTATRQE